MTTHKNPTVSLQNAHMRLEVLEHGGPRLVGVYLDGIQHNQLAELPDFRIETAFGLYRFYGGHRLWHAPEAMPRTYIPDNEGASVEIHENSLSLSGPVEPGSGMQKSILIEMEANQARFSMTQKITNCGLWPVRLAPWSITQLPVGGMAIFPQTQGAVDAHGLLPNRQITLWPYSQWRDKRLYLEDDLVLLHALPFKQPFKLGYFNRRGWMAYLRDGVLLVKRFQPQPELPHLDNGCNTESYSWEEFIELEILGPEQELKPGESTTLVENWEFLTQIDVQPDMDGARSLVEQFGLKA